MKMTLLDMKINTAEYKMFTLTRQTTPVLTPDEAYPWEKEGVFNPGVTTMDEKIIMLYRAVGEREAYISKFGLATSSDGIHFTRASTEPVFVPQQAFDTWGTEDPRITKIDEDFFVTYVAVPERIMLNGESFPRTTPLETSTALLKTHDFFSYENLGIISAPRSDNKDIVLFPKKINGKYCMLHRPNRWDKGTCDRLQGEGKHVDWPCDLAHLPEKPAIWIAWSDDLKHWTDHHIFLAALHDNDSKIGPGIPPIETSEGWLLIYHHMEKKSSGVFVYTAYIALFDLVDPTICKAALPYPILSPQEPFEKYNGREIVFPTGGFIKDDTLFVYYGASDYYVGLATGSLSELLQELSQYKK